MASLTLQDLKAQRSERPFPKLFQRPGLGRRYPADHLQRLRCGGAVGGQGLADADIGRVERVALPEAAPAGPLHEQGIPALPAEIHRIEQIQQSAVIYIRVSDEGGPGGGIEIRKQLAEQGQHLLPVAGVARVNEQVLPPMPEDAGIAAAGRLNEKQVEILPEVMFRYPWAEGVPAAGGQRLAKSTDIVKRLMKALPPFVQQLHDLVGVDDQLHPPLLRQSHPLCQLIGEGNIENAVVQDLLRLVVVHHTHRTQQGRGVEEVGELLRLLYEQPHLEHLPCCAVLLGAEIGDIEIVLLNEFQYGGDAAGRVPQSELHQQHSPLVQTALETADLTQALRSPLQTGVGALHFNKQRVRVNSLIVADPRDIQIQIRDDSAGFQERAGAVRHGGDKGFLHGGSLPFFGKF